jgi:hypothetical protein
VANLVISGVGALIGYSIGGPTGAQLGWLAGSMLGGQQSVAPQQLADITLQTSAYGTPVNRIVGTQRVAGNVIWYGDKKQYTKTTGGKGGAPQQTSQGWTVDFAVGICVGPIKGIRRVWSNGTLIIDCSTTVKPLTGQLYLGNATQLPDPTIEATEGAGNVPAYRGLAYIVMNDFDLGISGVMPQLSFEVVKDGVL